MGLRSSLVFYFFHVVQNLSVILYENMSNSDQTTVLGQHNQTSIIHHLPPILT